MRDHGLSARAAAGGIALEHVRRELRRDDDSVALSAIVRDVLANDRLRMALRIAVRGIDDVAATLEVRVDDALRLLRLRALSDMRDLVSRRAAAAVRSDKLREKVVLWHR